MMYAAFNANSSIMIILCYSSTYSSDETDIITIYNEHSGGACGVMVIVVGNGHGDTSSNPGRDWLHFT